MIDSSTSENSQLVYFSHIKVYRMNIIFVMVARNGSLKIEYLTEQSEYFLISADTFM